MVNGDERASVPLPPERHNELPITQGTQVCREVFNDARNFYIPIWARSKTEMVWAQNKINRTCEDDPTGHCTRMEKERQTEKEMGRPHNGVDRTKVG